MRVSRLLSCAVRGVLSVILLSAPELLVAQISVTPDNGPLSSLSGLSGQSVNFTFRWTGTGNAKPFYFFCYPSNNITSCAPNQSPLTLPPNFNIPVTVTYATGVVGSGVIQLKACDNAQCSQGQDYGNYNVTIVPWAVVNAALRDSAPMQAQNTTGFTTQYTVTNKSSVTESLTLSCQSSTNITCSSISPSSISNLGSGASATVTVTYATGQSGWGWVQLTVAGGPAGSSDLTGVNVVPYTVAVTPDERSVGAQASASRTQLFTIGNVTSGSVTYTFTVTCTGSGISNCSQPASQSVPAGSANTASVSYTTSGTIGATGRMRLQASGTPGQDSGTVNVTVANTMAPDTVDVTNTMPGTRVEPQFCLTVAATRSVAYQCGDLRVVHALATTRTMNRVRTPTLLYSSQYAHPYPLVAANVSINAAAATPDSVVATLRVNSVVHGRGSWSGADWVPGSASRIVVADTALVRAGPHKDTLYTYTLEVVNYYGPTPTSTRTTAGTFAVIDRSASPFGAGWWLVGLEHLDVATKIWTSGDGALRQYLPAGTNVWAAAKLARPDTLKWNGTYYLRTAPHGDTVKFDAQGRHVATVNRLGHQTSLSYETNSCGRLQSITLPPTGSGRVYQFAYASTTDCTTKLQTVTAPPVGATARVTTLTVASGRVTGIRDPDNSLVNFSYGTSADTNRIITRTDRRGTLTTFTYDAGKKVARVSSANGSGRPAIVARFRAVQSYGLPGSGTPSAIDTAVAYSRMDAPRLDVGDTSVFWENKLSAPYRIMNAQGSQTRLVYGDTWPALVTLVVYANGRKVGAVYDDRGNLTTVTDSSVFQNGKYATTRYVWNRKWDFDSIIVRPEGDSIVVSFDSTNGNRLWQRDGRGASSEIDFYYYSYSSPDSVRGLLSSTRTALQTPQGPRDSITYNAQGNLARTKTALNHWTYSYKDNIGRDTLILSPTVNDSAQYKRQDSIKYDLADRVIRTRSVGPKIHYIDAIGGNADSTTHAESLWVATYYNPEGQPDSVQRWSRPNWNNINTLTTRWLYDAAGRRLRETAPDGASDSTVYDAAGNAVSLITRRGDTISLTYDMLNRLTQRITPSVTYGPWNPSATHNEVWYFPGYRADPYPSGGLTMPNNGAYGLIIAADIATFSYDVMGNVLTADNSAARIRRNYNPNGSISGDTLIILPYVGTDTTLHVYKLAFTYDLDGRRTSMRHPYSIAPRSGGTVKDLETYSYDTTTGLPRSVTDVFGYVFEHTYDLENRLSQLDRGKFGSGGTPQVRTTYVYNAEGQDSIRTETWVGSGNQLLHTDTLFYDARGKVIRVHAKSDTTTLTYTGLSALAWSSSYETETGYQSLTPSERHLPDALGNSYEAAHLVNPGSSLSVTGFHYNPTTGRLDTTWSAPQRGDLRTASELKRYDGSGNIYQAEGWNDATPYSSDMLIDKTASFFDAGGRLRVQDHRSCRYNLNSDACYQTLLFPEYNDRAAFEEYRYDALGRRVLVRTRSEWRCYLNCRNAITRVVWNGDQILYEISSPGATSATVAQLEQDTAQVVKQDSVDYTPWGRLVYTHGLTLDAPLELWRMNFSNVFPQPTQVLPVTNWKGQYDLGIIAGYQNPSPSGANYCQHYPTPQDTFYCFKYDWPAPYMWKTFYSRSRGSVGPYSWMGSLVEAGRDNSGQMYRRNRYYDPATGRFTQEDHIGLAGGLNLYGFANGDPVNFSDPFGDSVWVGCRPLQKRTEHFLASHCAIRVGNGSNTTVYALKKDEIKGATDTVHVESYSGSSKEAATYNWQLVPVPKGQSSDEFDTAVTFKAIIASVSWQGRNYSWSSHENSNYFVFSVIDAAGGRIPRSAIGPGWFRSPGLCGGGGLFGIAGVGNQCSP